jgi:anti-sigma factor RsiW
MCDQRERLMDYLYDEAAPADRQGVEAHLETCGECRSEMRAFRRVRQDLLAWEVPAYESVWTPFAPVPVAPWYHQVPAWAMAAAAGLMIMLGSAGGFAANALLGGAPAQSTAIASVEAPVPEPAVTVAAVPPGLDEAAVRALIRGEIASSGVVRVANTAPGLTPAMRRELLEQTEELVFSRHKDQWERMGQFAASVQGELANERRASQIELGNLRDQIAGLQQTVNFLVTQQNARGQQ